MKKGRIFVRRMLFISAQRMADEEMKSQQPRVACFSLPGDDMF